MLRLALAAALLAVIAPAPARAEDAGVVIAIRDHHFVPETLEIPAGTKVKLVVRNEDKTTSEFESVQFHREKVVQPGGEITLLCRPARPRQL